MHQSGHCHECTPNFQLIARDYARVPAKPVLYGAHAVWQCHAPERHPGVTDPRWHWREASYFEGASHAGFIHRLLPVGCSGGWVPAQEWIASKPVQEFSHIVARRDYAGHELLADLPTCQPLRLNPAQLACARWRFG